MKPLNIKFGSIKEMLSKEQMKIISGGSCVFTWNEDCTAYSGTSIYEGDAGSQVYYDEACSIYDCCDNVDCT